MKEKNLSLSYAEVCRMCAEACKSCAARWKKNSNMDACVLVCRITTARCEQVLMYGEINPDVFDKCAEACNACAHECEKYNDPYCRSCAEISRKCAGECLQMAA